MCIKYPLCDSKETVFMLTNYGSTGGALRFVNVHLAYTSSSSWSSAPAPQTVIRGSGAERNARDSWVFAAPDRTGQNRFSKMSEFDNNPFAAPDSDNPFNVSAAVFSPSVEAVSRARKPAVNSQPTRQETCWVGVGEGATAGLLNAIRRRRRDWQRSSQSAGVVPERGRGSSLRGQFQEVKL